MAVVTASTDAASSKKSLVVVTGATSGIGQAAARAFHAAGNPVLVVGRRAELLEQLKNELDNKNRTSTGNNSAPAVEIAAVDVTDREALSAAINSAEAKHGPVDCLLNNAGVMLLGDGVLTQDPKEWERMLSVNIVGVLNGMSVVMDSMKQRKTGTVINVSSIAGRKTFPNHSVYCATKFAVHALTENVREEVAKHNIRCTTIAPGVVETEILSHQTNADMKEGYEGWKATLTDGALAPEEVADAILFAYSQRQGCCIREIVLAPTAQEP